MVPLKLLKRPWTVAIFICFTEKPIVLWLGSILHVVPAPAAVSAPGRVRVAKEHPSFFVRRRDHAARPAPAVRPQRHRPSGCGYETASIAVRITSVTACGWEIMIA
jgi:hypothetical protein